MRAHRRAGRARPQRPAGARLARAGGGARGGRARRAAPAQLPARLRGRHLLHARGGLHALPRPQHAARRAAELPRRLARRGGRLRRRRWRCGSGGSPPRADAFVVPSAFALGAAARARRAARRPRARDPVGPAHVRGALARPAPAATRSYAGRLTPEKGVADAIAGVPRAPACRSSSPATGRDARRAARARAGPDVRFTGRVGAGRARRAARAAPRSRSSPRATRRSCRSPRSRRWRPGCRSSPSRAGGLAEIVPERGPAPAGRRRRDGRARSRALWGDAAAGERALAVGARAHRARRWSRPRCGRLRR